MCDVIERIESFGIDHEQFIQVMKSRKGPKVGRWSAHSITLIVLGVVDEEWKSRTKVDEE
jgi:hypothetical protein